MNTQAPSPSAPRRDRTDILEKLGWNDHFERLAASKDIDRNRIARILSAQRDHFLVADANGERFCAPSGKLRHKGEWPVTGDWVVTNANIIEQVIDRKNILSRGEAGSRGGLEQGAAREQPIGANIDAAFIVCGLDRDYNPRRIERYLALVYNCGIAPVVVLTKADLNQGAQACRLEIENLAFGAPVATTSCLTGDGVKELRAFLGRGRTVAMLGSSGAGKSTLANALFGSDIQATAAVSAVVGKGRHTTTARELIPMPQGGLLMDNPGIREIAFSSDEGGLEAAFPDIRELAASCRFTDCSHTQEPGCAVLRAVENGELRRDRLDSFHKMNREMEYLADRREKSADRIEKERWRDVALRIREMKRRR